MWHLGRRVSLSLPVNSPIKVGQQGKSLIWMFFHLHFFDMLCKLWFSKLFRNPNVFCVLIHVLNPWNYAHTFQKCPLLCLHCNTDGGSRRRNVYLGKVGRMGRWLRTILWSSFPERKNYPPSNSPLPMQLWKRSNQCESWHLKIKSCFQDEFVFLDPGWVCIDACRFHTRASGTLIWALLW